MNDTPTPHDWIEMQQLRAQRRDAGLAFLIIAVVIIVATAIGMLAVAYFKGGL